MEETGEMKGDAVKASLKRWFDRLVWVGLGCWALIFVIMAFGTNGRDPVNQELSWRFGWIEYVFYGVLALGGVCIVAIHVLIALTGGTKWDAYRHSGG